MNSTDTFLPSQRGFALIELLASANFPPPHAGATWKLAYGSAEAVESDTSALTATSTTHANRDS